MELSPPGAAFIRGFEKCALVPYRDAGGRWTVGYGHLITAADGPPRPVSLAEAQALFDADVGRTVATVDDLVRVPLEQHRFDALAAFAFNVGVGAFAGSTLLKCVNAVFHDKAVAQFLQWNKAGGVRLNGLLARRAAEALIYAFADYGARA